VLHLSLDSVWSEIEPAVHAVGRTQVAS